MSAVKFNTYFSKEATPSEGSSNGFGETAPVKSDSNEAIPDSIFEETVPENDELARLLHVHVHAHVGGHDHLHAQLGEDRLHLR